MTELSDADLDALWRMAETDALLLRVFHRLRCLESARRVSEDAQARAKRLEPRILAAIAAAEDANGIQRGSLPSLGRQRTKPVLRARETAAAEMRRMGLSYPEIKRRLGMKSHGTIMAYLKQPLRSATGLESRSSPQ